MLVADNDNKLPVDLDNCLSAENFVELVKKRPGFVLEEFYPSLGDQLAEGPEGRFVHELVVPFTSGAASSPAFSGSPTMALRRSFPPGSEWLYAKIYAGNASVDQLLRTDIGPFVRDLQSKGLIDGWFFIRYGDPDWHLRLRLHGDPGVLWAEAIPRLQVLLDSQMTRGLIWKAQMDTYVRELERYGDGESMLLSECVFQVDSEAAMTIMERYSGDTAADVRWRLCIVGMDMLLEDLGFSLDGKITLLSGIRGGFLEEFHGQGALEHQIGDKFRKERSALEGLLQGRIPENFQPGIDILKLRSQALSEPLQRLKALEGDSSGTKLPSLAASYLHMHTNRMLRAAARAQELVLYDFLLRIYESRAARIVKADRGIKIV